MRIPTRRSYVLGAILFVVGCGADAGDLPSVGEGSSDARGGSAAGTSTANTGGTSHKGGSSSTAQKSGTGGEDEDTTGTGGSAEKGGSVGTGGSTRGRGGSGGDATGGRNAGGSSSSSKGGGDAGRGGGSVGAGGASLGTGGSTPGAGGASSRGGNTGTGGSSSGTGGSIGRGGSAPGAGGSIGRGGSAPGAGGSAPGTGGSAPGTGGSAPGAGGSTGTDGTTVNCSAAAPTGGTTYSSNGSGSVAGGYHYELWRDGNGGSMTVFGVGAAFKATWANSGDFLARVGLKYNESQTHDQIGVFKADYAFTKTGTGGGYSFIGIYGWTNSPLVEYYIVEDWFGSGPPTGGGTLKGSFEVDGGTYNIYTYTRVNMPSIKGTSTFPQFFSVRQKARQCGHISISEHFKKWASVGLNMGKMYECKILVEAGGGSGSLTFSSASLTATK